MSFELDFPVDFIERILLKKVLFDKKYLRLISNSFDIRWYQSKDIAVLIDLATVFYKKYNACPSIKVLQALLKRSIEAGRYNKTDNSFYPDIDYAKVNSEIVSLSNFEIDPSDEAANANIKKYLTDRAMYYAISDNIVEMEKTHNVAKCLKTFEDFQKMSFDDTDLGLSYFDPDQMKAHWDYILNPEAKIKTGWGSFDEYTNGGFLKDGKSLYIFMGQAGLGKSVFLSNLTVNFLKQGLSAVVISLEMSQDVYATRFDAHISKNNVNRLMDTHEDSVEKIKAFYAEHPTANLYIKEYPPRSIRTSDIELYLDNLKSNGKHFDVVVVDYLNLVLAQTKSDNMYMDALDVSEKLRSLSYKYGVPVVSAVQANSAGMNNENIGMEHISESRGIAHTADFLVGLFQMEEDRRRGEIKCRILKNRLGGQVGKVITMSLNPENLTLEDNGEAGQIAAISSEADQIIANASRMANELSSL